jgi:diguanylate cyclase (GGDEF)-like protein
MSEGLASSLAALWDRFRDGMFRRVDALDDAALALLEGRLDDDARRHAEREAHKLAGAVGTFGFAEAGRLAREAEHLLEGTRPLSPPEVLRLSELAVAVRRELERPVAAPAAAPASAAAPPPAPALSAAAAPSDAPPLLLLATPDDDLAGRVAMEAQGRGLATRRLDPEAYPEAAAAGARAALVDLSGDAGEHGRRMLRALARDAPATEVLVLADGGGLGTRLEVARLGARAFLQRPTTPARVVEAALALLAGAGGGERHVLALDDDPVVLASLRALLEPRGVRLTVLDDPRGFWDALERERPDLVVVDFDMPHASGADLCRVVRGDARWSALPVLVLTGRADAETVERVFAAGADDFVSKPFVGPELVARIESRLERARLQRLYAETDPLTGAANRARTEEAVAQLLRLAGRHREPLSLAVVDVDGVHAVNARWGHAAGDEALRRVARALRTALGADDVLGRWGGGEFVAALYGADKDAATARLSAALERVHAAGDEAAAALSLYGGVAEAPGDGTDGAALYRAASGALRQAHAGEPGRILPVGWTAEGPARAGTPDVVLVEDDEALGALLVHALETRGLQVEWLRDGEAAVSALCGPRPALRARAALLDVDLPGRDGLGVLRALARDGVLERTRAIMLTVRAGEREVLDALELGAFDHVAKPFSIPVLLQRVRRALREAR